MAEEGCEVTVWRNDRFKLQDVKPFDHVVLSPGPGIPSEAGLLEDVIRTWAETKPILGICLGEQAIGEVFGGKLFNLPHVFHGVQTPVHILEEEPLFRNLPSTIQAGRYHSWVVSKEDFPACLQITAESEEGQIMALRHRTLPVHGIQFHPESILTPCGRTIIHNFILP